MVFRWNDWNLEHAQEHGVSLREAEWVVGQAAEHEWRYRGDGKWLVKGARAWRKACASHFHPG